MNKKLIKDFQEGENVITPVLLANVLKGVTASGSPYLSLTLSDKSGTIEGKLWDVKEAQNAIATAGQVLEVNCDVIRYKNNLQVKIHSLRPLTEAEYDLNDFIVCSEYGQTTLRNEVYAVVDELTNQTLKTLVTTVLNQYDHDFFLYPAASRNHHDYVSGLAEHVYGMLQLGKALAAIYPFLNRDLLLSGIILHDVGKLTELSGTVVTEYTPEGKLLGHISIMQAKLAEIAEQLGLADKEEVLLLRHMILSHHGEYEFGSPVLPMTPEAEALSFIDNLDARMNMVNKATRDLNPGEFSQRIFALENRSFYKAKL